MDSDDSISLEVDVAKNRYPYSIVWGHLPCLTWICPCVGHMGICDSQGRVHDFAGPYTIGVDHFMTGPVIKYWQIDPRKLNFPMLTNGEARTHAEAWDLAIRKGDADYKKMMHTLCWNNCHAHVGHTMKYMGSRDGSQIMFFKFMFYCKYVSLCRFLATYLPFVIIVGIIFVFSQIGK